MLLIHLIRHAQAGPRQSYDQLSEVGRRQARLLGERLAASGLRFDAVYSGRLERQRRTAEIFAEAYRAAGVPLPNLAVEPCWDEFDLDALVRELAPPLAAEDAAFAAAFEEFQRAAADLESPVHRSHNACDSALVRAWVEGRFAHAGESWEEFKGRSLRPLRQLAQRQDAARLAVFTSATPVSLWVGEALALDDLRTWRLAAALYNSSVTTVQLEAGELRLVSFNNVPHLPDPALWTVR